MRWEIEGPIPRGVEVLFQVAKRHYETYIGHCDETGFMVDETVVEDGICYEDDVTRWLPLTDLLALIDNPDEGKGTDHE